MSNLCTSRFRGNHKAISGNGFMVSIRFAVALCAIAPIRIAPSDKSIELVGGNRKVVHTLA